MAMVEAPNKHASLVITDIYLHMNTSCFDLIDNNFGTSNDFDCSIFRRSIALVNSNTTLGVSDIGSYH